MALCTTSLALPITILIVDDHALVRSALSQVLASQPEVEHIVMAHNYAEAEQQTAQLHPDIIWLDLHIAHAESHAEVGRFRQARRPEPHRSGRSLLHCQSV